jgi:class 3 adenylate cyclase
MQFSRNTGVVARQILQPWERLLDGERVVRRLSAILAADVVGYSRLMGLDESCTLDRLKAHRAAIDPLIAGPWRAHRKDDRRRIAARVR